MIKKDDILMFIEKQNKKFYFYKVISRDIHRVYVYDYQNKLTQSSIETSIIECSKHYIYFNLTQGE